ncbi:MAG TPA: hypothetical protein VKV27_16500 [Solirubrobacteraceae bacterium]|nr:hypothetical protein [Solirubrobacteraceae bacterium]
MPEPATTLAINAATDPALWRALVKLGLVIALIVLTVVILIAELLGQTAPSATTQIGPGSPIPAGLVPVFDVAGRALDVNPYLLASVAYQESSFGSPGSRGVNSAGCAGFMQICVGGRGGDSWDETVTLIGQGHLTLVVKEAYLLAPRPASYPMQTQTHPNYDDPFDAVMAAAALLRAKVGGVAIPNLDQTAYRALCGYYGACADAVADYAPTVLARAQLWEQESALHGGGAVAPSGYVNPFASVSNLTPFRVDEGVDYGGSGPIRALGDGVVYNTDGSGWPGGTFIGISLTSGPYAGLSIYYAENIIPWVTVGQRVRAGQVVGVMVDHFPYTESGWATGQGQEPLALALGQEDPKGDPGGWTTAAGASFNNLLVSLGAPSGELQGCSASGVCPIHGRLPPGYPPP